MAEDGPRQPKRCPRQPKTGTRGLKTGPRQPKIAQRRSKTAQERLKDSPKAAQDNSREPPNVMNTGPHLGGCAMESEGGVKKKFPAVRPMNYRCGLRPHPPPRRSTTNARLMRALLGRGGLATFWGLRCNLCSSRTVNISLSKAFCRHLRGVQKAFQTDRQTDRQTSPESRSPFSSRGAPPPHPRS